MIFKKLKHRFNEWNENGDQQEVEFTALVIARVIQILFLFIFCFIVATWARHQKADETVNGVHKVDGFDTQIDWSEEEDEGPMYRRGYNARHRFDD